MKKMLSQNGNSQAEGMQAYSNNFQYNTASALSVKLDTKTVLDEFESNLRGQKTFMRKDEIGNDTPYTIVTGKPKCNELGIQTIKTKILSVFNPQTGQGNLTKDHYDTFMFHYRLEVSGLIVENCYKWEIEDGDLDFVIDTVCDLAELFLTRPIDNLERESNAQQIKSHESHITRSGQSWLPFGRQNTAST